MMVCENTPERLVLERRPRILTALFGSGLALSVYSFTTTWRSAAWNSLPFDWLLAGVLCLVGLCLFASWTRITFDRAAGTVTRSSRFPLPYSKPLAEISGIEDVRIRTGRSSDGEHHNYYIVTRGETIALMPVFAGAALNENIPRTIKAWLAM